MESVAESKWQFRIPHFGYVFLRFSTKYISKFAFHLPLGGLIWGSIPTTFSKWPFCNSLHALPLRLKEQVCCLSSHSLSPDMLCNLIRAEMGLTAWGLLLQNGLDMRIQPFFEKQDVIQGGCFRCLIFHRLRR